MRPSTAPSLFPRLALVAMAAMPQMACNNRDPKDIGRIAVLEAELAKQQAAGNVDKECTEVNGKLATCTQGLEKCTADLSNSSGNLQRCEEGRKAAEASNTEKLETKRTKAEITARVNQAIEAAGVVNPTNREIISKLFSFILLGDSSDGGYGDAFGSFPYMAFAKAFDVEYDGSKSGLAAQEYAKNMDVNGIANDALAVFAKLSLADKAAIAMQAKDVIPAAKDAAALYPKYAGLFRDNSFSKCMTVGSVWFQVDKDAAAEEEKGNFDPVCKDGGLVSQYHREGSFERFVMRLLNRLHVPAAVLSSTADKALNTVQGK